VLSSLVDAIRKPQSDYPHRIICLQKVQFDAFVIELHLGYYILSKKPKMHGKWGWGQFATLLPVKDFKAVLRQAQKKGGDCACMVTS
jgi:hypothetical protein